MKRITLSFAAGLLTGVILFGGTAVFAAGVIPERSNNRIFVDGREAQMEAYTINGNNYVRLRDIGREVGFCVTWDGTVQISTTAPYSEEKPMKQATGAVSETYSREMYRALLQVVGGGEHSDPIPVTETGYRAMQSVTAAISGYPGYDVRWEADGTAYFTRFYSSAYAEAATHCQPFIDGLNGLSDRDKAQEIACFVCDRLTYEASKSPTPRVVLASDGITKGNCMSYARNFKFLCDLAGIPCIFIHSDVHQWNQVYVEGRWWYVDVCALDAGDDAEVRRHLPVLRETVQGNIYRQSEPELTEFVREVMVPGPRE